MEKSLGMTIDYNVKIDVRKVSNDISKDIVKLVRKSASKIQASLNGKLEDIVFKRLITGVPNVSGNDYYEMGVPDINQRLQSIIRIASQNFRIKVKVDNLLSINIGILEDDYSQLLSLPESIFSIY